MKMIMATAALLGVVHVAPATASPLVVQCLARASWATQTIKVIVEIALPQEANMLLQVSTRDGKIAAVPDGTLVGLGTIQVTEALGQAEESHRHEFLVTRMPDEKNSLVGFYLTNSYVNSIRADLWEKEKRFLYFDTYNNEVLRGECQ